MSSATKLRAALSAQALDVRVVRVALDARVPAQVVVAAVAVVFRVRLVALLVVAHEIEQREPVVTRDEVDAIRRAFAGGRVEVAAARDARRDLAEKAGLAAQEPSHRVAVAPVPLGPAKAGPAAD